LVSPALWDAAKARLAANRDEDGRNRSQPYLLRGRIRCALCGARLRASPERSRRMYRCASRETPTGPCGAKRVPSDAVEAWVWTQVHSVSEDPTIIASELTRLQAEGPDQAVLANKAAVERRLATVERQQATLLRAFRERDEEAALPWDLIKRELAQLAQ